MKRQSLIKTIFNKLSNRLVFVSLCMLLQIVVLGIMLSYFIEHIVFAYIIYLVIAVIVAIRIIVSTRHPAYKIAWLVPLMIFPVFGELLYLIFGVKYRLPSRKRRKEKLDAKVGAALSELFVPKVKAFEHRSDASAQSEYISNVTTEPPYENTETDFIVPGEELFERMLSEIEKAEKFIFAEYFILSEGIALDRFTAALERKAKEGVDVRLIYDDLGSIKNLPRDFAVRLEKRGIKCGIYHRFLPVLSGSFNSRDHRKMLVIDGNIAFTGGINIADEYINGYEKFGHWLDCGVMLKGDAAWTFTVLFLSMWGYIRKADDDFSKYMPDKDFVSSVSGDGIVQPFSDVPADDEPVGENVYINMISRAKHYVYICTPYLVIGDEFIKTLASAAKSGVDVRIMMPGIPDKHYVHAVAHSYYSILVKAGVRIYEYKPGFVHSKTFVCDDKYAVCGTINLDFRSLYLQHECAVWMYKTKAVRQMYDHYMDVLSKCTEITKEWCKKIPWYQKVWQSLLRVFAPLM